MNTGNIEFKAEQLSGQNYRTNRIVRWLYTVVIGALPLLVSLVAHHLRSRPAMDAFHNPPELSVFTLVLSTTVLIDISESGPTIGWINLQVIIVLIMSLFLSYAAVLYGSSVEIPGVDRNSVISRDIMVNHASYLALICVGICTIIESLIALKERKK